MEPRRTDKLRVCVIGAGAAGLCAARHLAANPTEFEFQAFERTSGVGGTWVYNDSVGLDHYGYPIHSSMYKNLRTNLPKEIMSFPDYPDIKGGNRSVVSHDAVLNYLKEYADHFHLERFIQFNTIVESVKVEASSNSLREKWTVGVKNLKTSETRESIFDAVMVCNGHYFNPYIPPIPGISDFHGQIEHSHNYRIPNSFTGKTVILLGAASSGIDIAMELADNGSCVYLSHNNDRLSDTNRPLGFNEVEGIDRFESGKFVLKDGTVVIADVLMYCTGYLFTYPFLDQSCKIKIDENYVSPLYKHLINVEHPSMCLIGIPLVVVPFPMFHMQVLYFLSVLIGRRELPPESEMLEDSRLKSAKKRHAHKLASGQWAYNDELARLGGFPALPPLYRLGYELWSTARKADLRRYKDNDLLVDPDGRVSVVGPTGQSC